MLRMSTMVRTFAIALLAGSVGFAGCGNAPKPKELKELERILGEEGANEVKEAPGARGPYEKSRKLRRAALDEWEDNDIQEARQYAIRGKIKYRTAEAIAQKTEAKKQFDESKAKLEKVNPKVTKLDEERHELRKEVQELHQKVQKAQQAKARARRDQIEQEADSANKDAQLGAQNQIDRALTAKKDALDVQANEYAKGAFNRAENELKSAQSLMDSESFSQAEQTAKSAQSLFDKAKQEAKPKYEDEKAKENPKKRLASLEEKLKYEFGDRQVETVGRGVRVIVPELFSKGGESLSGGKRDALDSVAELAQKFDEFDIVVEGYTREGNATENLTISQVRAQRVKKYLKEQGVDGDRIDSEGKGQSNIRYSNSPGMNDRVEITFRSSR